MIRGRNATSKIVLGTPQTILQDSDCPVHRQLFRDHFKVDPAVTQIKRIEIYRDSKHRDVELSAIFPDNSFREGGEYSVTSRGWGLTTHQQIMYNDFKILRVDPRWMDVNQIRRWKEDCNNKHPIWCRDALRVQSLSASGPTWLIDCWRHCLVAARPEDEYIALSYVWGTVPMWKTCTADIDLLQQPGALTLPKIQDQLPLSIKHAIALAGLLRERYLWIDSLCIVQDDEVSKHREIQNMAGIYTNFTFTMIFTYDDASRGIPGIRGISSPRNCEQTLYRLDKGHVMTQAMYAANQTSPPAVWSKRAWTFQEGLLSTRRLVFEKQSVRWECYCGGRRFEDFYSVTTDFEFAAERRYRDALHEPFPDMCRFAELVSAYNDRVLSYPEDAHDAFSGILTSLGHKFYDGFIFGLPLMNLDVGLLWRPKSTMTRRQNRDPTKLCLPSWSWVGWHGEIDEWAWYQANDYVKSTPRDWVLKGAHVTERTLPTVQWYISERSGDVMLADQNKSGFSRVDNLWLGARENYLRGDSDEIPAGWSRTAYEYNPADFNSSYYRPDHGHVPKWVWRHESSSIAEFWYPLPLRSSFDPVDDSVHEPVKVYSPLIGGETTRITLYGGEVVSEYAETTIALRTATGEWAGCLQLHEALKEEPCPEADDQELPMFGPGNHDQFNRTFELASISLGYNYEHLPLSNSLAEWKCPERPINETGVYTFHNVLYIVWENECAYRRGIGRVEKQIWDKQSPEKFTLILG